MREGHLRPSLPAPRWSARDCSARQAGAFRSADIRVKGSLATSLLRRFWTIPILGYHRVGEPKGDHVPTVRPGTFDMHLRFFSRHRYRVLDVSELIDQMEQGRPVQRRSVVLTFDDGYEETSTIAAPLLRRFGFPATVFVSPAEIGLAGFMTWEQLRAVARDGITVGSHTAHHTFLPLLSAERAEQELMESKQLLEQRLGQAVFCLSYPVGGFTPEIQAMARSAGYRAACTTNRGLSKYTTDLFALRRIKMTERDRHHVSLWAKLSGYYDCFRRLERPA